MDGLRRILDTSRKARMSQKIRAEPGRNLIDVLKNTDTRALAYLWIAVELNYNMVVFGKNGETDTTVSALSMLVPRYHAVLDISKDNNMGSRINFMKMVGRKTGKTRDVTSGRQAGPRLATPKPYAMIAFSNFAEVRSELSFWWR